MKRVFIFLLLLLVVPILYSEENEEYKLLLEMSRLLNKNSIDWVQDNWRVLPFVIWKQSNDGVPETGIDKNFTLIAKENKYYLRKSYDDKLFELDSFDIYILSEKGVSSLFSNNKENNNFFQKTVLINLEQYIFVILAEKEILIPIKKSQS